MVQSEQSNAYSFRLSDLRTLVGWLSPDYLIPAAREHGIRLAMEAYPDLSELMLEVAEDSRFLSVFGAKAAYQEVRGMIRNYLRYVRHRDQVKAKDLGLAQALRAAGYVGNFQPVTPLVETDWRRTARDFWPQGQGTIPGDILVRVGNKVQQKTVDAAAIKAISECLVHVPEMNRALLQGRIWNRMTGHVMLHLMPAPEQVRSVVVDASLMSLDQVKTWAGKAVRNMVKAERHELKIVSDQLLRAWAKTGFIASPAGAMISCAGASGVYKGKAALLTGVNGIPIAITVGRVEKGKVWITADLDHRVLDGPQAGRCYRFLERRIPEILKDA